jgi:hypothetical protein
MLIHDCYSCRVCIPYPRTTSLLLKFRVLYYMHSYSWWFQCIPDVSKYVSQCYMLFLVALVLTAAIVPRRWCCIYPGRESSGPAGLVYVATLYLPYTYYSCRDVFLSVFQFPFIIIRHYIICISIPSNSNVCLTFPNMFPNVICCSW